MNEMSLSSEEAKKISIDDLYEKLTFFRKLICIFEELMKQAIQLVRDTLKSCSKIMD